MSKIDSAGQVVAAPDVLRPPTYFDSEGGAGQMKVIVPVHDKAYSRYEIEGYVESTKLHSQSFGLADRAQPGVWGNGQLTGLFDRGSGLIGNAGQLRPLGPLPLTLASTTKVRVRAIVWLSGATLTAMVNIITKEGDHSKWVMDTGTNINFELSGDVTGYSVTARRYAK